MKIHPLVNFEGKISSSPSKSYSHRVFFLALLANSPTYIINPLINGDVGVTINFCRLLGAKIEKINLKDEKDEKNSELILKAGDVKEIYKVTPPDRLQIKEPREIFDGKNSGTSIRFLTALSPLIPGTIHIKGDFFKLKRPLKPLLETLAPLNINWRYLNDDTEIMIENINRNSTKDSDTMQTPFLTPNVCNFEIPGNISSQFITGLLLLTPKLSSSNSYSSSKTSSKSSSNSTGSIINLTTHTVSTPFLKISEDVLSKFGISFQSDLSPQNFKQYIIPGNQNFSGQIIEIPGDYSSASFIIAAAALNPFPSEVEITNLDPNTLQGDKSLIEILQQMNADIRIDEKAQSVFIKGGRFLEGTKIDCGDIPDLFPILCVVGLHSSNITILYNLQHLRSKESDRISNMVNGLKKMGAQIDLIDEKNAVIIEGPQQLNGSEINHGGDHRIAMALTIAAIYARSDSFIANHQIVTDSYPDFFKDLMQLGIKISNIDDTTSK
ncbi:MAG: 3-phosphoshikimate 1-carboxyvinyltransferase [Promethearchaeota archaeon]